MAPHSTQNNVIKLLSLGGCWTPDPLLFLGGLQPPRSSARGPAAPHAQFRKGSASKTLHFLETNYFGTLILAFWKPLMTTWRAQGCFFLEERLLEFLVVLLYLKAPLYLDQPLKAFLKAILLQRVSGPDQNLEGRAFRVWSTSFNAILLKDVSGGQRRPRL